MGGSPGRHRFGKARALALAALFALLPPAPGPAFAAAPTDPVAAAPMPASDDLPRHELETRALVDPEGVLAQLPARLRKAQAAGDWREQALLQLARSNACRVLANWPCQRDAGTAARMAAALGRWPILQVRGLIAEARACISLQEFSRGERLLGAAEHLLEANPSPELSADIDLAYSSLSYTLGKPAPAADFAARGLRVLGSRPALPIRVRLLRNQANALNQLGRPAEARALVQQGIDLVGQVRDPKLSAELYLEDARIAQATGDNAAQVDSGERVLAAARKLSNNQLLGLGHEMLGMAARARGDRAEAKRELDLALDSFRALGLDREERRVLRALAHERLDVGAAPDPAFARRLLALEESLDASDYELAGEDLEARMKYEQQRFDVQRLQAALALNAQRERTLTYQRRFALALAAASLLLFAVMAVFVFAQRRFSARLQQVNARLRESERRLSRSEMRMRGITDNMPALIAHIDRDERYQYVNTMSAQVFGVEASQIVGRTVLEARGEAIYARMRAPIAAALRGETVSFEGETEIAGIRYHYQSTFVPDRDADGIVQGFFALTFDISRLKEAEEALDRLARIDSLTGVANRRQFQERLGATLAHARRQHEGVALLTIDIDHFKSINDGHGHPAGDAVIVAVAERLQACVREDDLVARLGGDEFVVLLASPQADTAITVARKLLEVMREPVRYDSASLPVGVSIGVAYSPGPIEAEALLVLADRALYQAKAAGRNTFRQAGAIDTATDDA